MSDLRQMSEYYARIGARLIEDRPELEHIKKGHASIVYLTSEAEKKSKGKIVRAQCEKVPERYRWGIPANFTITVFKPNVVGLSERQKEILIFHELLHVGIEESDQTSLDGHHEKYYIKPHDLEDFMTVIDMFGPHWDEVER